MISTLISSPSWELRGHAKSHHSASTTLCILPSMSSPTTYRYKSLDPQQIRLLRLKVPAIQQRPDIELEIVNLDSLPNYEAISYTWDGQECDQTIVCNGRSLLTTMNCIKILEQLATRSVHRFWMDAICIDQQSENSAQDKRKQLPLMGEIYSRASRVLIWLGEATHESNETFAFLNDISRLIDECGSVQNLAANTLRHGELMRRLEARNNAFAGM